MNPGSNLELVFWFQKWFFKLLIFLHVHYKKKIFYRNILRTSLFHFAMSSFPSLHNFDRTNIVPDRWKRLKYRYIDTCDETWRKSSLVDFRHRTCPVIDGPNWWVVKVLLLDRNDLSRKSTAFKHRTASTDRLHDTYVQLGGRISSIFYRKHSQFTSYANFYRQMACLH